jgi:hypothetical protein
MVNTANLIRNLGSLYFLYLHPYPSRRLGAFLAHPAAGTSASAFHPSQPNAARYGKSTTVLDAFLTLKL